MLIARGDLENYCSSCKNDEFVKKFFIKKTKTNKFIMKEMFDKRNLLKSLDNNQKETNE